jgi:hypothetical protein
MPLYLYQTLPHDGKPGEVIEVEHAMSDPPLTHDPQTGHPLRRLYEAPRIATRYTPGGTTKKLDPANMAKAGFSRFERDKLTGTYHKTHGKEGPESFRPG